MFNGIIERTGLVCEAKKNSGKFRLGIESGRLFGSLKTGDSVSVNGVCLTLTKRLGKKAFFDVVPETLKRSALGSLKIGDEVNLELSLKWQGRVSGHFVLGHVDGVGSVKDIKPKGSERAFLIQFPKPLGPYIVEKGSIAIDGVSLTVGKVQKNSFWVHLIPHTFRLTNFKHRVAGEKVNLEGDYLAKLRLTSKKGHYKLLR